MEILHPKERTEFETGQSQPGSEPDSSDDFGKPARIGDTKKTFAPPVGCTGSFTHLVSEPLVRKQLAKLTAKEKINENVSSRGCCAGCDNSALRGVRALWPFTGADFRAALSPGESHL